MSEPVHVTDDSFQNEVLESDVPVIVYPIRNGEKKV